MGSCSICGITEHDCEHDKAWARHRIRPEIDAKAWELFVSILGGKQIPAVGNAIEWSFDTADKFIEFREAREKRT